MLLWDLIWELAEVSGEGATVDAHISPQSPDILTQQTTKVSPAQQASA